MGRKPLQELPLEHFLLAIPDSCATKQSRTNKRPLSPGGTSIVSPAKRRNLAAQGVFPSECAFKSPPSSLRKSFASPARFTEVLAGAESPARILDFGTPKHLVGDPQKRLSTYHLLEEATPTRQRPSSSRLAPSPELKPRVARSTRHERLTLSNDVFSDAAVSPMDLPHSTSQLSEPSFILIPRELPPRPDPHSIHYPGFEVYQDPHIVAYPSRGDDPMSEDEEDNYKENKRVLKKALKPPSSSLYKAALRPDLAKSPKFKPMVVSPASTSTRKHSARSSTTPLSAKKQGRRMLEDELDAEDDKEEFVN